ncbi:sensor histidine kinase [Domibacillus indicus]|uniref:sensor histidine kinase n=1 Tax=Domibacillus indicus TaxID=1437523 RepID=UPI0006182423|nr:sensor histidine kinase [Domibacillus indicus]
MKTIRMKLLLYFLVFVVLFNVVSYSIYASSRHFLQEYHSSFEGFLLLNEISQQSTRLYEQVNAYAVERDTAFLDQAAAAKKALLANEKDLQNSRMSDLYPQSMAVYRSLMKTLAEESEKTIEAVRNDEVDVYPAHLNEVRNVAGYVQEATLNQLNLELNEYQQFYDNMEKRNAAFQQFTASLFVATLLLAVMMALLFSRGITRPIQTLMKAANDMSAGRLEGPDIEVRSKDELHQLALSFNQMRADTRRFIEEMKEKAALDQWLKELELRQLQNQINPHFLFNTLNTIKQMAYLEDAHSTSNLIEAVSTLLRYSLGDVNKAVTLGEELKAADSYFSIQKTRFPDRVAFRKSVDESCLKAEMPALILQPIIENAFIHGIEPKEEGGEISVSVRRLGREVVIEVADTGVGMREEVLDRIRAGGQPAEHVGHSTGIGLNNVFKRLHLFYKGREAVELASAEGAGTRILLKIPAAKEEGHESGNRG